MFENVVFKSYQYILSKRVGICALKTKSFHDANFVVSGGLRGCLNTNCRCYVTTNLASLLPVFSVVLINNHLQYLWHGHIVTSSMATPPAALISFGRIDSMIIRWMPAGRYRKIRVHPFRASESRVKLNDSIICLNMTSVIWHIRVSVVFLQQRHAMLWRHSTSTLNL